LVVSKFFWKILGINLILLNIIVLIVFGGFIFEKKIHKDDFFLNDMINDTLYFKENGDIIIGDKSANVTVYIYYDYTSSFCRKFSKKTYDKIKEEYVDNGKLKIVFKNYPKYHFKNASIEVAVAMKCIDMQNESYDDYLDVLLKSKINNNKQVVSLLKDVYLDIDYVEFEKCINNEFIINSVEEDIIEAENYGITVLPTIFIDDFKIEGIKPYGYIKDQIDKKLFENK